MAVGVEAGDCFLVEGDALGLAYDGAVPIEPYGSEVGELDLLCVRADARAIQVLHTHEKARPCRACEQPGEEGGAQVAEVQRAGGARGEAPVAFGKSLGLRPDREQASSSLGTGREPMALFSKISIRPF